MTDANALTRDLTPEEVRLVNQTLLEKLASTDPTEVKQAYDSVREFTRWKVREDGFQRKILPPMKLENEEIDRLPWTDKPIKVVDFEPDSMMAKSIPFGDLPENEYIRGIRYVVGIGRIVTPRFTKDVDELRTYHMDIRQVLSDNALKDMLYEEDGKFIAAVNSILVAPGAVLPTSGIAQWVTFAGGIDRDNLWQSLKIMPSTPSRFEVGLVLVNNLTIKDVAKFGRDEQGGDLAQDMMVQGFTLQDYLGTKWLVTNKQDLVPEGTFFHFAEPKALGKCFYLEEPTMYIRREAYLLEFFSYESIGATIANPNSVVRVDFT